MKGISYLEINGICLQICERDNGISNINYIDKIPEVKEKETNLTKECKKQLLEYFEGKRKVFDIRLDIRATDFQKKCYKVLSSIEYGKTISYKEEAKMLGSYSYARAVGQANAKNPIPIIIPCHRVVHSNGKIGNYTTKLTDCSIDVKKYLLDLEKNNS